MKQVIFRSSDHWTGFITRIALGILMLPHGLQKAFGFFGGYGFEGTMGWFTNTMNTPWVLGALVIVIEFLGSLFLIAGLATRLWALAMIPVMLGAIFMVHLPYGWFMNWNGTAQGEGFEYHIAMIVLSVILVLNGAGRFSVDRKLVMMK